MKHRLYYTAYLLIAFWMAFALPGKYSIALLVTIIVLPLLSAGVVYYASRNLKIIQTLSEDHVVKDQTVHYILRIQNSTPLFIPFLEIKHYIHPSFSYSDLFTGSFPIPPRSQKFEECDVDCILRGKYAVGCKTIETWDYLKIFRFKVEVTEPLHIVIHPKIKQIRHLESSAQEMAQETPDYRPQEEDFTTVTDFRKYTGQDSVKRIHWKLSAKKEELIVKKYASQHSTGTAIALNLSKMLENPESSPVVEDRMIELAVSMVHSILRQEGSLDFLYNTNRPEKLHVENIHQFHHLYSLSALLKFGNAFPFENLLKNYQLSNPGPLSLFILTAEMTSSLCEQAVLMASAGYSVTVVDFSPLPVSDPEKSILYARLDECGISPAPADTFISTLYPAEKEVPSFG